MWLLESQSICTSLDIIKVYLVVLDSNLDPILHITMPPVINPDPQKELTLHPCLKCAGDNAIVTSRYSQGQSNLKY